MQIFARNPRQIRKGCLEESDIQRFKADRAKYNIRPVVVHIPYTLNLATSRDHFHEITIREFMCDLREAHQLGVDYLVTHLGSYKGTSEEDGVSRVVHALKVILKETRGVRTKVLLENTAGSGQWLGYRFEQLGEIIQRLNNTKRVGLCLDTAHAWAAGYDLSDAAAVESVLCEIDATIGVDRLFAVHLNDTEEAQGSRKDRHCDIGKGLIGLDGFSALVNHPLLKDTAFILETPKACDADDIRNLRTVKKLYKGV